LRLADGKPVWRLETGLPAGQGFFSGDEYYLPLRADARDKRPGIAVLDPARGERVAFVPARTEEGLGNLLASQGLLISQTATSVNAFPAVKGRLGPVEKRVREGEKDPALLLERARLRLVGGRSAAAVDDLRAALELKPTPAAQAEIRAELYAAL